jgi:hypothetical protein
VSEFYEKESSLENYWRAIILFGKNVASYKFALAHALYDLKASSNDLVTLEQLAGPFTKHLCRHLDQSPKQATSSSSKFLEACRQYNDEAISRDDLIASAVKLGFVNVIDAFHVVNRAPIQTKFFIDERKESKGIRITDNFYKLTESSHFKSFTAETEARWRLVEEAWKMGVSRNLIAVEYDDDLKTLFTTNAHRRTTITSCRDSLNGYQKGRCFYCYDEISIESGADDLADVDHFLPFAAKEFVENVNGVWNLVLACTDCNRGAGGKFEKVPTIKLLERLHQRNEYFINSHLPLRETLIQQIGKHETLRKLYLQKQYDAALSILIHQWEPEAKGIETF